MRRWIGAVVDAVPRALPALIAVGLFALLTWELLRDQIVLTPISVPARLQEAGMTPEVAARRLQDDIAAIGSRVRGEPMRRSGAELSGSQPDFAVPFTGLSLSGVVSVLREVLGLPETRVGGEFTTEGDQLRLRLRVSGAGVVLDETGPNADALLRRAAPHVWRAVSPVLYAWYLAESAASEAEVQQVLGAMLEEGSHPPEVVQTLRVLLARSLGRAGRFEESLALNEALLRDQPGYGPAVYGRGLRLRDLGRLDEAEAAVREAQRLMPQAAFPRVGLALVLRDRGQPQQALAEIMPVLGSGAADGFAVAEAAMILLDLGRVGEALPLARRAVNEDPKGTGAQTALGLALLRAGRAQEALAPLDRAIAEAPYWPEARLVRVEALLALGRVAEARAELATNQAVIEALPRLARRLAAVRARLDPG
jgi:Flp pilus assembly protein TadD